MASAARPQQQHVQTDGAVAERRLRPIYEWLDNGNNKKALQEAEKVLRKTPSLQAARALRALAMLRLGRADEALTALATLAAERPCDDTTLQAMTISYRESQQLHKVCELYEAAVKAESTSEDLYTHLFMAYVRVADFHAQHRTAVALYKVAPKNPYYFWAVMSIVLQAMETEDAVKKGVLLSLAQRMIDKFINENKLEAQQEARLYIMILQLQNKYEDILKFMETPLYSNLVPGVMPAATIPYLKQLGRWRELNTLCKELLWDNLDRWDYYEPYFESAFHLIPEEEETAEKCHEFICQLIENIPEGRTIRGPYLARLELYKRLHEADKDPKAVMGDPLQLCVQYVKMFAHKPCCVVDMKPYMSMISIEERRKRSQTLLMCLGMDEHTMPETIEEVQTHVNCLAAWLLCHDHEDKLVMHRKIASTLRSHYLRALARGLAPSTATEFSAADTYAVLSSRQYYFAALEEQSSEPILEALSLLEFVLKNSPSNYHCKLLALKFYHLLGNGCAADSIYSTLEVKHVQLSSLGWLHAALLQSAALPTRALQLHSHTRRFHTHHTRDSVDHLTYSYKYGTFEKLCELMEFVKRVERCAWCAAAGLERALLELLTLSGAGGTFNPPPAHHKELSDNRDLTIMTNYDPPHLHNPRLQEETFKHELALLKQRSCIVNAVALSIELASTSSTNNTSTDKPLDKEALLSELEDWLKQFDETTTTFKEEYRPIRGDNVVSVPFPSRIIGFVNSPVPYRELYMETFSLAATLARGEMEAAHERCPRLVSLLGEGREALRRQVDERSGGDRLWSCRQSLEELSNYVEFIGIITFELGVYNELVTPQNKRSKRKNATAQPPADQHTARLLSDINMAVQDSIAHVEQVLDAWSEPTVPKDIAELFAQLTLHQNYEDPVQRKLQTGHANSMSDLKTILGKKSKFLKNIL